MGMGSRVMLSVVRERSGGRQPDEQCGKKEEQRPHAGDSSAAAP
jgi:hypothetical protein